MLSREELRELTVGSIDPNPTGRVVRRFNDVERTDEDLVAVIKSRNRAKKPTYLLRMEYARRLDQRGL